MKVSVIIAAYNAQATLSRCLDSVRAQVHENLQIIVVDDGSTDATLEIAGAVSAVDARVHILHQDNAGPAAARNAALDAADGKWIAFVDADDVIEADYLAHLLGVADETGADLVASDCMICEPDGTRRFKMIVPDMYYEQRDDLYQDFLAGRMPWSLWAKLYRAELFRDTRFDEALFIAEDLEVNARIFATEGLKVATSSNAGYSYNVANGSIDHSFTQRHLCQFDAFERVVRLVHDAGIQTVTTPEVFYEQRVLNCLRKAIDAGALTGHVKRAFAEAIARHRTAVLRDEDASPQLKLRMRASYLGITVYKLLNRLHP